MMKMALLKLDPDDSALSQSFTKLETLTNNLQQITFACNCLEIPHSVFFFFFKHFEHLSIKSGALCSSVKLTPSVASSVMFPNPQLCNGSGPRAQR